MLHLTGDRQEVKENVSAYAYAPFQAVPLSEEPVLWKDELMHKTELLSCYGVFLSLSFNTGSFSIIKFYDRRIRRIMPALMFTMLLTTFASFFFMLPYDLKNFGQSLVSTSLGANNILLYLTSGYWSLAAEFKPLYHTWSLGVEEQYYFIIPIILMLSFLKGTYRYVLSFLFIASWFLSLISKNVEFDFYLLQIDFGNYVQGLY